MALLYIAAGIYHFVNPRMYLRIMPPYLNFHSALVYISGICEIVFGLLLIPESIRQIGAWLIIGLLILIFPANIQMAINFKKRHNPYLWLALVRLPLQVILIWWAWNYTKN
jgi:uncharacterized membrane protein